MDAWQVGGEHSMSNNGIIITINGDKVIDDAFGIFVVGGKTFNGNYQGKPIMAECEYKRTFGAAYMQCMVFVNNERAATLRF